MNKVSNSLRSRLTPRKELYANGWLSPEGRYFPVRAEGHSDAANAITNVKGYGNGEEKLEKLNWAKVSDNRWLGGNLGKQLLTQKQIDFIFDWCQLNGKKYPPPYV